MSENVIKLPVTAADAEGDSALDLERVSILVVDDLPEKLLAYEAILEELGQNLVMVRSGEEALKLVLKQEFAVILLDVNMPGMDGFETASLIRQRKKSSHTPIIFLTAFTDEVRMAQGYASGAVDYLPTPVVAETLKAKVKVFIELSQMRRKAALQAQEHALRQAAEESARRSEFLASASEIFTGAQSEQQTMHAIVQLPIPFLADMSILLLDNTELKTPWLGWASSQKEKNVYSQTAPDVLAVFPELREIMSHVAQTGQLKYLPYVPASALTPVSRDNVPFLSHANAEHFTILAVPLMLRAAPRGVLLLAKGASADKPPTVDMSLAIDFISRASASLENALLFKRIQEADQRKNEFLAMLAHELRNPLAPIRNALHVLRRAPENELRQQAEETIERQLKHMVHLVDDLMDVSRITQGKIELRKETMSLSDAIGQAVETAQAIIQQKNQTLTLDISPAPIWLNADISRISQIFANLLNNAAKYTDNGGHIEVKVQAMGGNAVVTVKDDGIGIPENMSSRIFDMFLQIDSSLERAQGGLGIGLTLVKNLVEMHGGTIQVQSQGEHKGSEFIVMLPTVEAPAAKALPAETAQPEKAADVLNVLIVDDNVESAKTLGWMMEEIFGHRIHLANSSQEALEKAAAHGPDVVLLDIGLPGMNGYEVCKAMHSIPALSQATFIAQTGWGQAEHRQRSKEAGFHYHLVKPVDIKELESVMKQLSDKRRTI